MKENIELKKAYFVFYPKGIMGSTSFAMYANGEDGCDWELDDIDDLADTIAAMQEGLRWLKEQK